MSGLLEVYRDFARLPERTLSTDDLRRLGYSPSNAQVTLHRLRESGLAESTEPGKVRLLLPTEVSQPSSPTQPKWERLVLAAPGKKTGFSVLPQRYPGPRPNEYVVPPGRVQGVADRLRRTYPDLRVFVDEYHADDAAVCLYSGKVRGREATPEEALLHVYDHAPRADFALALQSLLMANPTLNWDWLRRQDDWNEVAAVFNALSERVESAPFPHFRTDELPDLTLDELDTVAQAFTARSSGE